MVRMSELVRTSTPKRAPDPAASAPAAPVDVGTPDTPSAVVPMETTDVEERPARPTRVSFRSMVAATQGARPAPRMHVPEPGEPRGSSGPGALFAELIAFLHRARALVRASGRFPWPELERLIAGVSAELADSAELFWIANAPTSPAGADPLAFHQARVAVLAVRIGAMAGFEHAALLELGMAGCLIDVAFWAGAEGVSGHVDTASSEYRAHPRTSAEIVRRWAPPAGAIVDAVLQHHELEQGQGFPQGLRRDQIHPYAKVLGLVDRYASLTGSGVTRTRLRAHDVIRDIVRSRNDEFAPALIKALLGEISIFPPGTPVRLNTGELARVVGVNRNHPLRPRIEIVADAKARPLAAARGVDLAEAPFLYITGPVAE
jgi:HD domain-containing protein